MEMAHEHGADLGHAAHHGPRTMPASLAAPDFVSTWRMRAGIVSLVFALISLAFVGTHEGRNHLLRAYLMGYMTCFNLCGGALAFLMVQYVSGGKWGQILRRPLEAMTRTIWLIIVMLLPILFLMKHLYQWAAFPNKAATLQAYHQGLMTQEQQLTANAKHTMLSPTAAIVQAVIVLGWMALVITILNYWSVKRDEDPEAGTLKSFDKWRVRFENLSGP
jgi:hypothetical protein